MHGHTGNSVSRNADVMIWISAQNGAGWATAATAGPYCGHCNATVVPLRPLHGHSEAL